MRAIMVGKTKWKPLAFPLAGKTVNQKQYCIPGGTEEISVTIKDLKDAGVMVPTTSPFNPPNWPVQNTDESWRMTVDYRTLHQVVTLAAAATPDVVPLLEKIWQMPSPYLFVRPIRNNLLSADKASNPPSPSYLWVILTIQPCATT